LTHDTIYDTIQYKGGLILASIEKIIKKMKRQPNGIRLTEIDKVLNYNGYVLDRQKGSHRQYLNK